MLHASFFSPTSFHIASGACKRSLKVQANRSSSLPQKTLLLKCLVSRPVFNSVTLLHHTTITVSHSCIINVQLLVGHKKLIQQIRLLLLLNTVSKLEWWQGLPHINKNSMKLCCPLRSIWLFSHENSLFCLFRHKNKKKSVKEAHFHKTTQCTFKVTGTNTVISVRRGIVWETKACISIYLTYLKMSLIYLL